MLTDWIDEIPSDSIPKVLITHYISDLLSLCLQLLFCPRTCDEPVFISSPANLKWLLHLQDSAQSKIMYCPPHNNRKYQFSAESLKSENLFLTKKFSGALHLVTTSQWQLPNWPQAEKKVGVRTQTLCRVVRPKLLLHPKEQCLRVI